MEMTILLLLVAFCAIVPVDCYTDGYLEACPLLNSVDESTPLGRNLRKYFMFDPELTYVNAGSYGGTTRIAFNALKYWEERMERDLDDWFRFQRQSHMDQVRQALADYIHASRSKDIAFIPNASAGVNAVLRSLKFGRSDVVLYLDSAYGMVKKTLEFLEQRDGVRLLELRLRFPFRTPELVSAVESAIWNLPKNQSIKLAVFSHISSVPAIILPVEELVEICHRHHIPVLVDGAHAPGQIAVNITAIDADFYVGNGHKWLCTPKSVGFLWVKPSVQKFIHPTVISWNFGLGLTPEFDMIGTYDYCTWLTFGAAIEFRRRLGEKRILDYTRSLAKWAAGRVAEIWATEPLPVPDGNIGTLINVRVPTNNTGIGRNLAAEVMLRYNTFVPFYTQDGNLYARLSCQMYNERRDYEYVAEAVRDVLRQM